VGRIGLRLNIANGGLTQINGWNFNSFAFKDSCVFGASNLGISRLAGDTDNGKAIDAVVITAASDYTVGNSKRVRRAYLQCSGSGNLAITQESDGKTYRQLVGCPVYQSNVYVKSKRDLRGVNWQFKIENVNGNYFVLNRLSALFVILTRKRGL